MATYENFYDINPITVIDQNQWTVHDLEIMQQFRQQPVLFTPLINWDYTQEQTGARSTMRTEMLEGDTDFDEIPFTANYIGVTTGVDTRWRSMASKRYGDKVQLHESSNIFQQWQMNGGRDWRPLLRGILGKNVIRKHEMLARNAFLRGPQEFWTFAGGRANFGAITADDTFNLSIINEWRLRLGNTGDPVIPGDGAAAKVAMIPPGVTYDFMAQLPDQAHNESSMWRDAQEYSGQAIRYEIGTHKGVRFVETPNDTYGQNLSVLYNAGVISAQYAVVNPIHMGDGSPDPESTSTDDMVDDVWHVGQKNVVHSIQLESGADMTKFAKQDIVTIHLKRTNTFGVTNGVDILSGKTVNRRVIKVDETNKTLAFDRPIMFNYDVPYQGASDTGATALTYYAFVTKARHIGFCLVLGSRGGIMGSVARGLKFHEPRPIDDFDSVWRFVWDAYEGYNIWQPNLFECHFCAVTLPKVGGIITP